MEKHSKLLYFLTIILSAVYIFFGNKIATEGYVAPNLGGTTNPEKMKVVNIIDANYEETLYGDITQEHGENIVLFEGEFLEGYKKGTVAKAVQRVDKAYAVEIRPVEVGNTIIVYQNPDPAIEVDYMFAEYHRVPVLWFLIALFMILLVVFGRKKGVNTLISLFFTIAAIFFVYVPAILAKGNIYLWSIITCAYIIFMTLFIVSGFTKKSFAAIIGCGAGITVSGIIVVFADRFLKMTGLVNEDYLYLLMVDTENPIDIKAVIFGAIIIGAIGAIMDVSMSISASLAELKEQAPNMTGTQITRSGLVIGRDIMGTMANTLILAYIGSSLSLTLLLFAYNSDPLLLFNTELIVSELLQAIAGSFGILMTIPLTSIVCGVLYGGRKEQNIQP